MIAAKTRRSFVQGFGIVLTVLGLSPAIAADEAPNVLIERLSQGVLTDIRADKLMQSGDMSHIMALVNSKIMPNVDFRRMTASATGPAWRKTTPAQQQKLQDEFKTLLVRTYSGALRQVNDQTVEVLPMRGTPSDNEALVRTVIRGKGDPVQLDYRLLKTPGKGAGWMIYDINVMGIWLVDTYRPQFAQEINAGGIDRLIASLAQRNKANAGGG
ncbi:MAG: ABC transporter substrate-binding protein [Burkholderiaceae bacterium]|nr:ABC transporter substrate-binding protein [Burkholderiaceae bacterium]